MKKSIEQDAVDRFRDANCNCAQAVLTAFGQIGGIEHQMAMAIAAPFGGGLGRQREVCGAISGMSMALGLIAQRKGLSSQEIHAATKSLCSSFREIHGSIICRELLASKRELEGSYYGEKPCERRVEECARLLADYIERENR